MISQAIGVARWRPFPLLLTALVALLLAACAAGPTTREKPVEEATPEPSAALQPTDEEVMYRVFAGEYLGAEGDLEGAVDEYLEAAIVSDDPEIARRATRVAFAAEAWQQAAMAADRWALLDPQSIDAHQSATAALLNLGDYLGAEYHMLRILDLTDDSTDGWLMISSLLAASGDPEQADATLEQILGQREHAAVADVLYARSQMAVQARNLQRAFELARQAVEADPERRQFLTWSARLALNLKLPETALEYIRRAWLLDPEDHDMSLAYADLLARTGDPAGARKVMEEMPQAPDVMLSRILFELAASDRAAALALFEEFETTTFPDAEEKAYYQAQAAEALDLDRRAIELYAQVQTGERALASAIRRAELLARLGDMAAARRVLAEMRERPEELAVEEGWLAEARILREAGDREAAFEVLDAAVTELPDSVPILYTRALLAAELGWIDIAERDLRTIIAEQPENVAALNALGYTLADQTERYEEAEALIRQAYILQPHEPSIVDSMGWVAFRLGRYEEAEQFLRRAWSMDKNAEIGAHLGEVLWVSGRHDEAIDAWRDAQAIDADNAVLLDTLERLGVAF